jgi:hypothetical protein
MKVVIAASASSQSGIQKWLKYWNNKNDCLVLNYPKVISQDNFEELYPKVYKDFFRDIKEADIFFVANEKKNDIEGYIGAETFGELSFALTEKLINRRNIKLVLAHMPSKEVACYDEIMLWKKLDWIDEIIE